MESRRPRNYSNQQQNQPQLPHQHSQQQRQQQHQSQHQEQSNGRIKGATRILTAQESLMDQEQHPNKPQDQMPMQITTMDNTTFTQASNQNNAAHIGAPPAAIERCNSNIYETRGGDLHSGIQSAASVSTVNMVYMDGTSNSNHINPSSSSYNIQTLNSTNTNSTNINNATTLAAQPIRAETSATLNQQQPHYDSPQVQPCDIKSLFECPICFDYAVPPIYQCQNGHLVCQSCSIKIAHCPTCRVPIAEPSIRNLQLDKLANQFQFPCKYNFVGCQWKSYWFKKREHEDICDFISYSCPCPGTSCKWTGLLSQVMPHLSEHHKSITTLSGEDIVFLATDINLKGAVDWVMIQSCFDHHFLLVLEKQENKSGFFAIVQLIGTPKEAEKFRYKLELSGQSKQLVWSATPRSILDGIQFSIATHDCLVFDSITAQHFLSPIKKDNDGGNGQSENLGINVTIERVQ